MSSVIEDIKSAVRAGAEIGDRFDKFNVRSVARGANEQSFQFPCLIDNTIPVDMATTVTRNLDRLYASWTQIYLSSIGIIDLNYIKNPKPFITKYQPKFKFESCEDDECDEELRDHLYGDDIAVFQKDEPEGSITAIIRPCEPTATLRKATKEGMEPYLSSYNLGGIYGNSTPFEEAVSADTVNAVIDNAIQDSKDRRNSEQLQNTRDVRTPKMGESDVKKINDMVPYTIELKLLASKGDSAFSQWVNFVVGVKTTLHLAKSDTLIMNLVDVLKNRDPKFNFIRWTTGEISLFKDLILHLDDINFDIANKSDRTGKFISSLKKLKKKYLKVGTFGVNRIAPFATIVISSATYRDIKDRYGFDLKNMTFASKIMSELFLMCFVILDDVTHTCDILVDGQNDYQTYSLDTLEREVTMNSNKLGKELTRMLGSN